MNNEVFDVPRDVLPDGWTPHDIYTLTPGLLVIDHRQNTKHIITDVSHEGARICGMWFTFGAVMYHYETPDGCPVGIEMKPTK